MTEHTPRQLQVGDAFPRFTAESVAHGRITLPDDIPEGNYGVVLAYRAHW